MTDESAALAAAVIAHIEHLREVSFNEEACEDALTAALLLIEIYESILQSHNVIEFIDGDRVN